MYRDGATNGHQGCPQYRMQLSISGSSKEVGVRADRPGWFLRWHNADDIRCHHHGRVRRVSMQEQVKATVRWRVKARTLQQRSQRSSAKHDLAVLEEDR